MDVASFLVLLKGLGVWGKGGLAIPPEPRLADDGKRVYEMDVLYEGRRLNVVIIGRGSGGGRARHCAGPEAGG